jgi:lysine 2,3-aminomutase
MSAPGGFITSAEMAPILAYLGEHREIREILVSGGDPLTADDRTLEGLFAKLRETGPDRALRVCTRVPITAPEQISPALIGLFTQYQPLRLSVHINHPRELSPESRQVFKTLTEAGIPVLVQTVLLKGVNSKAEILKTLFRDCLALNLRPYYLFQLDPAPGTAHFRLPLKQGLSLYQELQALWGSAPGLPPYALDLPGGGGKIRLSPESLGGTEDRAQGRVYLLRDAGGKLWPYPADE